jgi:plastocyanin
MRARVAVLTVIGGAIALACFSERGSGPTGTSSAECSVPVSVIDSMHYIVAIRNFTFQPDSIKVPVGATVTWVNCEDTGTEPHTTTSDSAGVWSSTDLNPRARFSHTFATAGSFPYHCIPHEAFMHGKLVVQ